MSDSKGNKPSEEEIEKITQASKEADEAFDNLVDNMNETDEKMDKMLGLDIKKRLVVMLPEHAYKEIKDLSAYFRMDSQEIIKQIIYVAKHFLADSMAQHKLADGIHEGDEATPKTPEEWASWNRQKEQIKGDVIRSFEAWQSLSRMDAEKANWDVNGLVTVKEHLRKKGDK